MRTLKEIFAEIGHFGSDIGANDKGSTHTYLEIYDELFAPYRENCSIMEIGLATGDSIKLFDEYFINSKITGIDISIVFPHKDYNNEVTIIEADATKSEFLNLISAETFDIIIDDGSHAELDQIATFNLLKDKMNPGGIYIIEDILSLELSGEKLKALHDNCTIFDMRDNGRFDNILILFRF